MNLKKKYIKRAYIMQICCEDCDIPMERESYILASNPLQYVYFCPCCKKQITSTLINNQIEYEFEEENKDV